MMADDFKLNAQHCPSTVTSFGYQMSLSMLTWTVKLSYGYTSFRSFSWTTILMYKRQGQVDGATSYKQVSKQLAASKSNDENMAYFTVLDISYLPFTFGTVSMHVSLVLQNFCVLHGFLLKNLNCSSSGSKRPQKLSITPRLFMPVWVQLRCIHAEVIWLPITLSRCVSLTSRNSIWYIFRWTNTFTCVLKVQL